MMRKRQNGFILFSVVILIMLAGSMLAVYTHLTQNMAAQTEVLHQAAWKRNLIRSGQNWVQHKNPEIQEKISTSSLELETASLAPEGSSKILTLTLQKDAFNQIAVHCQRLDPLK